MEVPSAHDREGIRRRGMTEGRAAHCQDVQPDRGTYCAGGSGSGTLFLIGGIVWK
jgi:hypothetical protein